MGSLRENTHWQPGLISNRMTFQRTGTLKLEEGFSVGEKPMVTKQMDNCHLSKWVFEVNVRCLVWRQFTWDLCLLSPTYMQWNLLPHGPTLCHEATRLQSLKTESRESSDFERFEGKECEVAGEMASQLRVYTLLTDLSLVRSTHTGQLTAPHIPAEWSDVIFWTILTPELILYHFSHYIHD